jgi:hypothetical protein
MTITQHRPDAGAPSTWRRVLALLCGTLLCDP